MGGAAHAPAFVQRADPRKLDLPKIVIRDARRGFGLARGGGDRFCKRDVAPAPRSIGYHTHEIGYYYI